MQPIDLTNNMGPDEKIVWQGRPNKKSYILRSFINPLLPVALVWAAIDIPFIALTSQTPGNPVWFTVPFFLLHLAPVWIYLFAAVFAGVRYRNTAYLVTDRAVYISGGVFSVNVEMRPLERISNVSLSRNVIDRRLKVGSVVLDNGQTSYYGNNARRGTVFEIAQIDDYEEVFATVRDLQIKAYRDAQYPNALREGEPPENGR